MLGTYSPGSSDGTLDAARDHHCPGLATDLG
jgi:hypothetical protein